MSGRKGKLALQREEAAAEERSRSKRERAADAERGPPPELTRSFRLPQQLLPDLLTVWELLQTLAPVLQVRLISALGNSWQINNFSLRNGCARDVAQVGWSSILYAEAELLGGGCCADAEPAVLAARGGCMPGPHKIRSPHCAWFW